ncbi:MAG: zinc ribbon domain-containing protein [Gemmatimonadetes bacterium]|jgi:putative FmdB family regulatory protein|nr:zinc ribbon domain-containing protein [Gemmatimonadota bacterium]
MPIYEYRCESCKHEFEALVRSSDVPKCEKCGADKLERLLSLSAIKSESTHALAMKSAKNRDKKQGAEREYTQREYEKNHD